MRITTRLPARAKSHAHRIATAACVVVAGAVALTAELPAATAATASSTVTWSTCPRYSDAVLSYLGYPTAQQRSDFRALWARTRCGTVQVPLDYSDPGGRRITIGITRLPAADRTHDLGSLLVDPGGPGSGYLTPIQLAMPGTPAAGLNQRHDLIGFDPRGVGYSTQAHCSGLGHGATAPPGLFTEAQARQDYDAQVTANQTCAASDPALLSQLTTANVARDLNQIRIALHQAKISYFGVSWGTGLGAHYRSLFPGTVSRMWLDSVEAPDYRLDESVNADAAATEQNFTRLAAWIAAHHDTYGFGTTATRVEAAVAGLENTYNAHPRTFTGLSTQIGGSLIATAAAMRSQQWPLAAELLKELRDVTGTTLPPTVEAFVEPGPRPPAPADAPQEQNQAMHHAIVCNEDAGDRGFADSWAQYRRRLHDDPVVGQAFPPLEQNQCPGWPFPVQPRHLRGDSGSLELSGHRYDTITPYRWTFQMRSVLGGQIYTVVDDDHADAISTPDCAGHIIAYFDTGVLQAGWCPGSQRS